VVLNLTAHQARLLRMQAQQLTSPTEVSSPAQLLSQIFAVQAQNLGAAYQSMGVRSRGLTEAQIAHERQFGSEICWRWSLRGTLHLMTVEDARWFVPLMAKDLVAWDRLRLTQLGYNDHQAKTGVDLIRRQIEIHGEQSRAEIANLLRENKLPFEGQATVHILFKAVCEGGVCPGSDRGNKPTYTLFEKRYGSFKARPRTEAQTDLALRYLQAYAPARPEDFAIWSGIKISEVRALWPTLEDQLTAVQIEGTANWMLKKQKGWLENLDDKKPVLRLLPFFDTYLLGYANREQLIAKAHVAKIIKGGVIDSMVTLDGWIIGTWRLTPRKSSLELSVKYFEDQPAWLQSLVEAEAEQLGRFLDKKVSLQIPKL
jgi:hypothetical protein